MRLLRQRRHEGAIVIDLEVFAAERALMVRNGLIGAEQILDREAVAAAVGRILDFWFEQGRRDLDNGVMRS